MLKNKKLQAAARLILSLGLLAWLINRAGPASILETLRGIDPLWFLAAALLFQVNVLVRAYRWYLLLSALDDRPPLHQLIYYYYLGYFFNNFIPSGVGGDVIKVVGLRQEYGQGTSALSSVLMDRVIGLLGSSLIAVIILIWGAAGGLLGRVELPPLLVAVVGLISLGIPLGLILLRVWNPLAWLAQRLPWSQKLTANARLNRLVDTIRLYPTAALLKSLLTSLPFTLALILAQYAIARGLQVDLPFYLFALFVPVISLVNLLPISFNGLGTREGAYLLLFTPVGVAANQAVAMALTIYIIRVLTGLLGGLLFLLKTIGNLIKTPRKKTT